MLVWRLSVLCWDWVVKQPYLDQASLDHRCYFRVCLRFVNAQVVVVVVVVDAVALEFLVVYLKICYYN